MTLDDIVEAEILIQQYSYNGETDKAEDLIRKVAVVGTELGQMIQAIVARNMYRIWFSIEHMMGITWWNAVDGCGMEREPTISGILTRSCNPKPAYHALNELINKEWRTNFNAKPDSNGDIKFRGFKGNYRIAWYDENGNEQFKIIEVK